MGINKECHYLSVYLKECLKHNIYFIFKWRVFVWYVCMHISMPAVTAYRYLIRNNIRMLYVCGKYRQMVKMITGCIILWSCLEFYGIYYFFVWSSAYLLVSGCLFFFKTLKCVWNGIWYIVSMYVVYKFEMKSRLLQRLMYIYW